MTKGIWLLLAAFMTAAMASQCLCDEDYLTNIELVEQAVREAAESMDVRPPAGTDARLQIDAGSGNDAVWLLDSVLKEELIARGWRIKAGAGEKADTSAGSGAGAAGLKADGFVLRLRIVDLGLKYGRSWRRYLLGGKVVERIARASIFYELIDRTSDQILVSSDVDGMVSDVVPASKLPELSNSKYAFASPELEKSRWDRYLEGGLVIAIIGVLVYLFYSNKTAS
ncbi:MAG: hypothetical protein PVH52_07690 [bacterium]|jgi:hypothetical protein